MGTPAACSAGSTADVATGSAGASLGRTKLDVVRAVPTTRDSSDSPIILVKLAYLQEGGGGGGGAAGWAFLLPAATPSLRTRMSGETPVHRLMRLLL